MKKAKDMVGAGFLTISEYLGEILNIGILMQKAITYRDR